MPKSGIRIQIIGGGVAAFEAAVAARKSDADARITIHTREKTPPYRRPALPRALPGDLPDREFLIKPADWYREQHIELCTGSNVDAVDRNRRELRLADGGAVPYDRLLFATGGHCFLPPIPGIELAGVLSLREYADLAPIREALARTTSAVTVVGGGLLGLELADALLQTGHRVRLVEGCPVLLGKQLAAADSERVRHHLEQVPGLELHLGSFPAAVLGNDRVQALKLADGTELPAELIFFSTGMRPHTELAQQAGLTTVPGGIRVDALLRTDDPDIFAAGDCAAFDGKPGCGLYAAARKMGATAGANLAGGEISYQPEEYPPRMTALGIRLAGTTLTLDEHTPTRE